MHCLSGPQNQYITNPCLFLPSITPSPSQQSFYPPSQHTLSTFSINPPPPPTHPLPSAANKYVAYVRKYVSEIFFFVDRKRLTLLNNAVRQWVHLVVKMRGQSHSHFDVTCVGRSKISKQQLQLSTYATALYTFNPQPLTHT